MFQQLIARLYAGIKQALLNHAFSDVESFRSDVEIARVRADILAKRRHLVALDDARRAIVDNDNDEEPVKRLNVVESNRFATTRQQLVDSITDERPTVSVVSPADAGRTLQAMKVEKIRATKKPAKKSTKRKAKR